MIACGGGKTRAFCFVCVYLLVRESLLLGGVKTMRSGMEKNDTEQPRDPFFPFSKVFEGSCRGFRKMK